jgi:sugar phosphate isomerase/epimerase
MVELCHFHLPLLDPGYIGELRAALASSGIELFSVLIDAGDITHADSAQREKEVAWVRSWLEVAARLGARCVRVIAGEAEPVQNGDWHEQEAVRLSAENLRSLAHTGNELGLQVLTENFRALGCSAPALNAVLDLCAGEVGLCADFGNFQGAHKYEDLASILPRATSVHAKADFSDAGEIEREDFSRCLHLARAADFKGPYSLIYSSGGDEWKGLAQTRQVVDEYLL